MADASAQGEPHQFERTRYLLYRPDGGADPLDRAGRVPLPEAETMASARAREQVSRRPATCTNRTPHFVGIGRTVPEYYYTTNLIRNLVGYKSVGNIIDYTQSYTNNYNSLQAQVNRRRGKVQWNFNYTWSRTIVYYNAANQGTGALFQFVDAQLMKNVANRRHAVNFNMGCDFPTVSRHFGNDIGKSFAKVVLDGWHLNGNGSVSEQPEHRADLELHQRGTDQRRLRHHSGRADRSPPRGAVGQSPFLDLPSAGRDARSIERVFTARFDRFDSSK
jgi:hypothetical protein